jgi:hypothetical protein
MDGQRTREQEHECEEREESGWAVVHVADVDLSLAGTQA